MNEFIQNLIPLVIAVVGSMAWLGVNALVLVYCERKFAGHIQRRPGPYEVGPHGILQTLIDGLKLMGKQLLTPDNADGFLYWLAPILSMIPVLLLFMPIPYGPMLTGMEVNLGLLLILAFSSFNGLAVILAGWGSNNKWGILGAARAVAQIVAYEIPLLLTVLAIAFMTSTLNLTEITAQQAGHIGNWIIWKQPLAFIIFIFAMFGETNRAPFDLAEAESELTAGFHTEYSSMGFGLFFMAEYGYMVVLCSVCSVLFLGGFHGPIPGIEGWWWMLVKTYALLFLMIWARWTFPRVRFDQLLNINWKWLLPLATFNLLATALIMKL
ncbi:MAG: NADH-quinone oxidoreductase subunit NuoH [Pseudodesulfovibrio sp.]|uniref:NADH-quinone oxidoreductase subunit H n=1 Tax=Pseudodesulfovibrio aespoeensis (strain ATCC 700646 / DSM 10631 / Aspo-2) TaxID=643562 RepID=E6VUR5_PSEA9|nr:MULTISPECIES: NADH-quinone oxidoreductase subunit NuoH [Pseudodesulfovibrio]MBU4379862.1 NADH-quinone oxidoreductase subunit NuoH [Pseudomonadota bacterium]ADU62306.1 NADH dehydrogenase (quinone) [Pseudodesulfovibrio aespoeensis Aspo-2]MBU4474029.1 NADH-quinone oxidoreductase subunit NuoH [Pseudomonadota bacterium]MBU4515227.1 NADH-quinone oxidoreductase subunit NuoH [Pseudomonadota bacterium]MBU4521132.1 NADH-quinone oxidoreductase subunit NuoH [Pseudomonadota bacterium]